MLLAGYVTSSSLIQEFWLLFFHSCVEMSRNQCSFRHQYCSACVRGSVLPISARPDEAVNSLPCCHISWPNSRCVRVCARVIAPPAFHYEAGGKRSQATSLKPVQQSYDPSLRRIHKQMDGCDWIIDLAAHFHFVFSSKLLYSLSFTVLHFILTVSSSLTAHEGTTLLFMSLFRHLK